MSAHDIAAELRRRIPNLPIKKLHKLLYYCQGHHLAVFDEPLFSETIVAWDMGPVVSQLWWVEKNAEAPPTAVLSDERILNTVEYVVSRYGRLSGGDLEHLTHSEPPWKIADSKRKVGGSDRIEVDWIKGYFRTRADADDDLGNEARETISRWARESAEWAPDVTDVEVDDRDKLLARLSPR